MCGITGHINLREAVDLGRFSAMTDTLFHRGPDGKGIYMSADGQKALGHRRLSFLDLSDAGKQPMVSNSQKTVITFNGEIYNYWEIKEELSPTYNFKTTTDTEVILAAYEKWGMPVTIGKLKGMFAFALLDLSANKVFLVRDHFGIKPLYYSITGNRLIFASELKAILASGEVERKMDYSAFCDYFVYRYIPSPKTIWQGINKVPPASYIEIDLGNLSLKEKEYWKPAFGNKNAEKESILTEMDMLLQKSVERNLRADVPVGAFLSGGYDSSALVYYMNRLNYKTETFSVGFKNWDGSEERYAKIVAEHFGATNESTVADERSRDWISVMPMVYDEPVADWSIIPTFMVSGLARKKVKAVLGGEGADELFGGYAWQKGFYGLKKNMGWREKIKQYFFPYDTVRFYASSMAVGDFEVERLEEMLNPDLHHYIPKDIYWFYRQHYHPGQTPLKTLQYMDMKCFMGEMVLAKVDRASMYHSLEVRVPYLDYELFDKVFSMDENAYFDSAITKMPLRHILKDNLPHEILDRKKQGFVGPDTYYSDIEWYKKELEKSSLVSAGLINKSFVDTRMKTNDYGSLWKLVVMERWFVYWVNETKN